MTDETSSIGLLKYDNEMQWHTTPLLDFPALNSSKAEVIIEDFTRQNENHLADAIRNLQNLSPTMMNAQNAEIFRYYQDCKRAFDHGSRIETQNDVWSHTRFSGEIVASFDRHNPETVYLSVTFECDWEPEHGLQVVFKNGRDICKIGSFDGHTTNVEAFGRPDFESKIYVSPGDL